MAAIFAYPLMWLAATALPVLVSIYFLHHHYQRRTVSSLMLWVEGRELSSGGKTFKQLSFPWIFLLELLIIILLILAGLGLRYNTTRKDQRVAIILDNSISMQAVRSNGKTVQDSALTLLQKKISNPRISVTRTIIAGSELISIEAETKTELFAAIKKSWNCTSCQSDLSRAITSLKRTNPAADIIVVSDRQPPANSAITAGTVWLSRGQAEKNIAIINAVRNKSTATHTRILIQVANYSTDDHTATIEWLAKNSIIQTDIINIPASEYKTIEHRLPNPADDITIRIKEADALAIDNSVCLIPSPPRDLRVKLQISDKNLSTIITDTINATKSAQIITQHPELLITDSSNSTAQHRPATLKLIKSSTMLSCTGPFIVDTAHPLTDGLSFDSLIWAASTNTPLTGTALISAGNIPLLSLDKASKTSSLISMQLDLTRSNIQLTPAWPVLFWNLIDWQLSLRNGFTAANYRTSTPFKLTLNPNEKIRITDPAGKTTEHSTRSNQLLVNSQLPGIYTAQSENWQSRAAINILAPAESDLELCKSGSWGTFSTGEKYRDVQNSSAPWFALAAMLLLFWHHLIISPRPVQGGRS